jgi:hypothetical protein
VGKKLSIMSERVRNTVTLFFRPQSAWHIFRHRFLFFQ